MNLKIVATSDLHGFLPEIIEEADIMIIAGDIVPLDIQFNLTESETWLEGIFAQWIKALPVKKVYMIAGNHDAYFEDTYLFSSGCFEEACEDKLVYLENEYAIYNHEGQAVKIFGTPYCHIFGNWPFMISNECLEEKFKQIPDQVDIIISHDPPFAYGDADIILEPCFYGDSRHKGNHPLAKKLFEVDYKLLFCGHIHSGDHTFNEKYKIANVSYVNEQYKPYYPPFYTYLEY